MNLNSNSDVFKQAVKQNVKAALAEDLGSGDITANLIPASTHAKARVICREHAIICGRPWVDEVFHELDPEIRVNWQVDEGAHIEPDQTLFSIEGSARSLLSAERSALNFLQLLSGTATRCHHFHNLVKETGVKLLDTRKTLPGLRIAQKYAVKTGGCHNHRTGLYDAFLIKENHIMACQGITRAISEARRQCPDKTLEIEVETLDQLLEASKAGADIIMLDNFSLEDMRYAVNTINGKIPLEASGNINENTLQPIAETGVDYISMGTLTKDCKAIDLSMRIIF